MAAITGAKVRAFLTRKVGPLPMWAWIGAGVGGVVVGRVLLGRRAGPPGAGAGSIGQMLGDSAIPVDVTGRRADSEMAPEFGPSFELFPIPEPIFIESGGFGGFDVPPTPPEPPPVPEPPPPEPPPPAPPAGCTKATLPAIYGHYPGAPNRFCPHGWHRAVWGACAGKCIRNVG